MDLSIGGHSQTLPGLKLPGQQRPSAPGQEEDDAPLVQLVALTERPSPCPDGSRPALDPQDPTTPGNITIPRPHGRKTPELGSIIALPVCPSRSRPPGYAGGPTSGGQEFRQALSKSAEEERDQAEASSDDGVDVISLLDPLSSSASAAEGGRLTFFSATPKATPPRGPSPQGLASFSLHPHGVLNPFAHRSSRFHFLPSPSVNPFSAALGHHQGPYFHPRPPPPPFSSLPGLYSVHALPPSGQIQAASPHSSHTLASQAEPGSLLPRPDAAEGHGQSSRDPFGDLLTVSQSAKTTTKVEELQRSWETFE